MLKSLFFKCISLKVQRPYSFQALLSHRNISLQTCVVCKFVDTKRLFNPIQGLWTRSVRLSVCPSGNTITLFKLNISTWNFLHILMKLNQELSSKMGKIGQKISMSWVPHQNQYWVYGAKKNFVWLTWNLVHLYFGSIEMISEKIIKIGWKIKKLWPLKVSKWLKWQLGFRRQNGRCGGREINKV